MPTQLNLTHMNIVRRHHNIEPGINLSTTINQHEVSEFAMPSLPLLDVGKSIERLWLQPEEVKPSQFSTLRSRTRVNSLLLAVTSTAPSIQA